MVKNLIKIIITLVLLIVFLVSCFGIVTGFLIGGWLHTYKTFTQKKLVAVVEVGAEQTDEDGFEYTTLIYKPVDDESALTALFIDEEGGDIKYEQPQEYKIYGDHFEVGGEIVKFNDFWQLINLRNIYKVTRIEGDYTDVEKAKSLPAEQRSVYSVNGGTDDYWRELQKNEGKYDFFVDSVFGNFSTKFVQEEPREYGLYITEDGFILDTLED